MLLVHSIILKAVAALRAHCVHCHGTPPRSLAWARILCWAMGQSSGTISSYNNAVCGSRQGAVNQCPAVAHSVTTTPMSTEGGITLWSVYMAHTCGMHPLMVSQGQAGK
mmetsp:Transcript_79811/g.133313  ORF Transcript_79811/g.133313 Transcript_79811/m.133313 type:complete len:109 (+) Transcript_79811:2209-2535(+)